IKPLYYHSSARNLASFDGAAASWFRATAAALEPATQNSPLRLPGERSFAGHADSPGSDPVRATCSGADLSLVLFPFNLFFSFRLVFHALCLGSEMSKHAASRQGNAKKMGFHRLFPLKTLA